MILVEFYYEHMCTRVSQLYECDFCYLCEGFIFDLKIFCEFIYVIDFDIFDVNESTGFLEERVMRCTICCIINLQRVSQFISLFFVAHIDCE